jgi:hypothetical protein
MVTTIVKDALKKWSAKMMKNWMRRNNLCLKFLDTAITKYLIT